VLHVVTAANRHLYETQLDQMYRHRTELFVEGAGWNLTVVDGREMDEGDDDRAVYLIAIDDDGHCRSSVRIRPVDDFSYLIDHMPEWVDEDRQALKEDPTVWEMARWINQSRARKAEVSIAIYVGAVEYMVGRGVSQCVSCPDVVREKHALRRGWTVRRLGTPRRYPEGGTAVGASLIVSEEELARARQVRVPSPRSARDPV